MEREIVEEITGSGPAIEKRSAPVGLKRDEYLLWLMGADPYNQPKIELRCHSCKLLVWENDPGLRITRDMIRCAACDAAVQTLKAAWGVNKWPTEEFKQLDPKTKANLFATNRINGGNVKEAYAMTCAKKRFEQRTEADKSTMRPLSYWVNLGYCKDKIKKLIPKENQHYDSVTQAWHYRLPNSDRCKVTEVEQDTKDILTEMRCDTGVLQKIAKVAPKPVKKKVRCVKKDAPKPQAAQSEVKLLKRRPRKDCKRIEDLALGRAPFVMFSTQVCVSVARQLPSASPLTVKMRHNRKACRTYSMTAITIGRPRSGGSMTLTSLTIYTR